MFGEIPQIRGVRRRFQVVPQAPVDQKKGGRVAPVVSKKIETCGPVGVVPFKLRVKRIPKLAWSVCKDSNWMLLVVEFFGVAGKVCSLAGESAAKFIPFLGIVSSPFYLFHSIRFAKQRLGLMRSAFRVSRIADAFFWGTKAIGSLGSAISDIVKPFAGGFQIAKFLTKNPAIGVLFNLVIPIILIVFGAVGGISEGWALLRSGKALRKFNKLVGHRNESLHQVGELIAYLEGPPHEVTVSKEERLVEQKQYDEHHYSGLARKEATQALFTSLAEVHDVRQIRSLYEKVVAREVQEFVHPLLEEKEERLKEEGLVDILGLLKEIHALYGDLTEDKIAEIDSIEWLYSLNGKLLTLFKQMEAHPKWDAENEQIRPVIRNLEENQLALQEIKETLISQGGELLDRVRSEIHRTILYQFAFVLMSAMTLSAGILFLLSHQYHVVASCITLTSSGLAVTYVLFDKFISQEKFLHMERFLKTIESRSQELA